MKKFIINLKSFFLNRRVLTIILLPFVLYGLYEIVTTNRGLKIYAVDPLVITYNGDTPPNPMFVVTGMLPGDEVEKTFNVKNDSPDSEGIVMSAVKTDEEKAFAGILDVEIVELSLSSIVFSGKLQDLFDSPPASLGNFPAGTDKSFRVKVKFPTDAGDEYQEAKVIFNIIWSTDLPQIGLPPECRHLQGIITRVVEGTEGNDRITGNSESELILAKGGNDKVTGSNGDDCIVGGEGSDNKLDGSNGRDVILGGNGNDKLDGSDDEDILYGGEGNDHIDGGNANDLVYGGPGNDKIDGGEGNDKIFGGEGNDNIEGGSGNDEIYGDAGNDAIDGESGNDKLFGNEGNDSVKGSSGNDLLDGGPDQDNLHGNAGNDTCINGEVENSCEI